MHLWTLLVRTPLAENEQVQAALNPDAFKQIFRENDNITPIGRLDLWYNKFMQFDVTIGSPKMLKFFELQRL